MKKKTYQVSFPTTYSLLPLSKSMYGEAGSDVYALVLEFATRRVEHRSEVHSNESQDLAEELEGARFRRRFCFVLQQSLLFRTRHHLCRHGVTSAGPRQLRSQNPVIVQTKCTERVTRSEGREVANGDRNGDGDGDGNGDRAGAETGTWAEAR